MLRLINMILFQNQRVVLGRASLVLILRDVTRLTPLLARLVQWELSLAFNPMLSLWEILGCYK